MNYKNVIRDIDSQIKQLEEARRVLLVDFCLSLCL